MLRNDAVRECSHVVVVAIVAVLNAHSFLSKQLYKEAGVPTKNFIGVPVFQAEGLTVTTQDMVRGALRLRRVSLWQECWCVFVSAVAEMLVARVMVFCL